MDGSNMPQVNATYTPADAQGWSDTIGSAFDGMTTAYAALKAWKPSAPEVLAMGQALASACDACHGMEAEAYDRLGLKPPLRSGGTDKT